MNRPALGPPAADPPAGASRARTARAGARRVVPVAAGAVAVLIGLLLFRLVVPDRPALTLKDVDQQVADALASATPGPALSAQVYQAVVPSLVLIRAKHQGGTDTKDETDLGSGVVVTDQGDILTSLHVVANADSIELTFADGTTSSASIVSEQPENDIAVVRADQPPAQLVPAVLGNPASVRVGDEAFVVGNPFGLSGSMSSGVISGLGRSFKQRDGDRTLTGLIQIDAAVNPGNSGGPLVDRGGRVIGIVAALVNPTDDDVFIGIGLAVPINVAGGAAGLPAY